MGPDGVKLSADVKSGDAHSFFGQGNELLLVRVQGENASIKETSGNELINW